MKLPPECWCCARFAGTAPTFWVNSYAETSLEHHHIQIPRARRYGGGRKAQLQDTRDKLLFILVYFRLYPTQEVQGFLFGIGQPQAHDWVHKLTPILNQALGYEQQLPERRPWRLERVLQECVGLELIIDATERRIPRPKDKDERKQHYSGKKKTFTVKNLLISQRQGKVLYLSDTYEGKKHDKAICDEEDYRFPEGTQLWKDTRFQGYEPEGVKTHQPKKKPRNGELSEADKERNQEISREHVQIEHHIGGIKRCNIVVHPLRTRTDHFTDTVMEAACGLHNFRLSQRQLAVA
ncbi:MULTISPECIES: transposase family protein [unclassified Leptolyngbya]|uniref:transposase family protein n=1 Tax=unclassified Leptolyngbya TaxID=2650499 RepID=UPI001687137A|nr:MULTISPECIES: transposase family protein [unclassified Leptolyngbya]MBD1913201.1 transposase [Leptolyngbya sp. FACHB-8]MBD2154923.1 transposase [Leptolyngbya sp. FACHB-16]